MSSALMQNLGSGAMQSFDSSFIVQGLMFPLAAGFVTPAFAIAGVLLASIPIVIHLLNRRRFRTVQWAAMEFLLSAMKRNRRRVKFEQWLLLATRCAALLLLGLALGRPVACEQSGLAAAATRAGLHVVVIDNSYSMALQVARPGASTQLDQAKAIATRLIESLSAGGESVAIVTTAKPAAIAMQPTYDLQAAAAAVARVEQSAGSTDLVGAFSLAAGLGKEASRQPVRRLEIITDGSRSAWEAGDRDRLATLGKELAAVFRVRHFNLAKPDQWNAAVAEVSPVASIVRVGFNSDLLARVQSFGRSAGGPLQWAVDNQSIPGSGNIEATPDTPPVLQTAARFRDGGPHVVTASFSAGDALPIDDTRYRVVDVTSAMKVLIVEGERGVGALAGSGAFLELALAPPGDAGAGGPAALGRRSNSYVVPEVVSDIELSNKVLADYRAVIFAGVGQVDAAAADALKRFVEAGGTLLLFMGEPVQSDNYNQVLLTRGLLPGPLTKRISVGADQRGFLFDFKPLGSLHPMLRVFSGEQNTGLDTAQIFTYWQLELPADTKAERVLDFTARDGRADPAITLNRLGAGNVVFISTTANAEWTSFPAKPSYVALVHEMLSGSVNSGDMWMNRTVGESLDLPPTLSLKSAPMLKDPASREVAIQPRTLADGRTAYRSEPLRKPGIYTLSTGAAVIPIAVNCPAEEADLRPIGDAGIRTAFGGIEMELAGDQIPEIGKMSAAGSDFGWAVMLILLGIVGVESVLAMKFGHQRR